MRIAAIEAGGTKFVLAIGDELGNIYYKEVVKTTTPKETMAGVKAFFDKHKFEKMAIGCFGPVDLDEKSETYGYIKNTPKKEWVDFNILGELKKYYDVEIEISTDVNCAALGEVTFGVAKGLKNCVYITIGTGIGVGAIVNGKLLVGMTHPEMGHILVRRHKDDTYEGNCIYHKDCLEGLACGPAILGRTGVAAENISEDDKSWEIEAYYIAQAIVNYILILSPEKVVLGGGVSKQKQLYPLIRKNVKEILNGYIDTEQLKNLDEYIVYAGLSDEAGIKGTLALGNLK